ncbi:MAG: AAA family ATPase [Pseudomonadota bacterium]
MADAWHPSQGLERDLYGHSAAKTLIDGAIARRRLHHAILLTGPCGIGKATFAWRLAARLLAEDGEDVAATSRLLLAGTHPDFACLEADGNGPGRAGTKDIGVDAVRGILRRFAHASGRPRRVAILDPVDALNTNAANALLKTLEEPPAGVVWLLVSHVPGRLPATIRSRALHVRLAPLDDDDTRRAIAELGLGDIPATDLETLLHLADGRPGRALALAGDDDLGDVEAFAALLEAPANAVSGAQLLAIADRIGKRGNDHAFSAMLDVWATHLAKTVKDARAGDVDPAVLAELAGLWDKAGRQIRDTTIFNLDRARLAEFLIEARPVVGRQNDCPADRDPRH